MNSYSDDPWLNTGNPPFDPYIPCYQNYCSQSDDDSDSESIDFDPYNYIDQGNVEPQAQLFGSI